MRIDYAHVSNIFGALSHDGRQLFRQYDKFDKYCFVDYIPELNRKFGKILVYADRAPQHKSNLVQEYLDDNPDVILEWFTKGSPQFNAVEKCWKQGKYNLLVSQYQPSLSNLKNNIANIIEQKDFILIF